MGFYSEQELNEWATAAAMVAGVGAGGESTSSRESYGTNSTSWDWGLESLVYKNIWAADYTQERRVELGVSWGTGGGNGGKNDGNGAVSGGRNFAGIGASLEANWGIEGPIYTYGTCSSGSTAQVPRGMMSNNTVPRNTSSANGAVVVSHSTSVCLAAPMPLSVSVSPLLLSPEYEEEDQQADQKSAPLQLPAPNLFFKSYSGTRFSLSESARFFVIKSFNAADVNASFFNSVWASTGLGNKRLSKAFKTASQVYLFFLVNGSGKFCGVARMTSDVDFNRTSDIWTEISRWKGVFSVEWVMVKDVPNKNFLHLRVPANENKPVTNSRDTQQIPYDIAVSMMKIFNSFKSQSSFLKE